jgi:hypothetical protein
LTTDLGEGKSDVQDSLGEQNLGNKELSYAPLGDDHDHHHDEPERSVSNGSIGSTGGDAGVGVVAEDRAVVENQEIQKIYNDSLGAEGIASPVGYGKLEDTSPCHMGVEADVSVSDHEEDDGYQFAGVEQSVETERKTERDGNYFRAFSVDPEDLPWDKCGLLEKLSGFLNEFDGNMAKICDVVKPSAPNSNSSLINRLKNTSYTKTYTGGDYNENVTPVKNYKDFSDTFYVNQNYGQSKTPNGEFGTTATAEVNRLSFDAAQKNDSMDIYNGKNPDASYGKSDNNPFKPEETPQTHFTKGDSSSLTGGM